MAFKFPSPEWTAAYKDAVNANPKYRTAGKDWTHGAVAYVIEANPSIGLPADVAMILDVHEGICRATTHTTRERAESDAPFVIVAPYARWKEVLQKQAEPIKAMMQGRLKLTKGHLPTIVKYVESSRQLVESAAAVPTEFLA